MCNHTFEGISQKKKFQESLIFFFRESSNLKWIVFKYLKEMWNLS